MDIKSALEKALSVVTQNNSNSNNNVNHNTQNNNNTQPMINANSNNSSPRLMIEDNTDEDHPSHTNSNNTSLNSNSNLPNNAHPIDINNLPKIIKKEENSTKLTLALPKKSSNHNILNVANNINNNSNANTCKTLSSSDKMEVSSDPNLCTSSTPTPINENSPKNLILNSNSNSNSQSKEISRSETPNLENTPLPKAESTIEANGPGAVAQTNSLHNTINENASHTNTSELNIESAIIVNRNILNKLTEAQQKNLMLRLRSELLNAIIQADNENKARQAQEVITPAVLEDPQKLAIENAIKNATRNQNSVNDSQQQATFIEIHRRILEQQRQQQQAEQAAQQQAQQQAHQQLQQQQQQNQLNHNHNPQQLLQSIEILQAYTSQAGLNLPPNILAQLASQIQSGQTDFRQLQAIINSVQQAQAQSKIQQVQAAQQIQRIQQQALQQQVLQQQAQVSLANNHPFLNNISPDALARNPSILGQLSATALANHALTQHNPQTINSNNNAVVNHEDMSNSNNNNTLVNPLDILRNRQRFFNQNSHSNSPSNLASSLIPNKKPSSSPCKNCSVCDLVIQTDTIKSNLTKEERPITQSLTCRNFGVYALVCQEEECQQQFIAFSVHSYRYILTSLRSSFSQILGGDSTRRTAKNLVSHYMSCHAEKLNPNSDLKSYFKAILLETSEDKNEVPSLYAKWVNWNGPDPSPTETPNHLKIVPQKSLGSQPCNTCRCCKSVATCGSITATTNGEVIPINAALNCRDAGIYAFQCKVENCKVQAVSYTGGPFQRAVSNLIGVMNNFRIGEKPGGGSVKLINHYIQCHPEILATSSELRGRVGLNVFS